MKAEEYIGRDFILSFNEKEIKVKLNNENEKTEEFFEWKEKEDKQIKSLQGKIDYLSKWTSRYVKEINLLNWQLSDCLKLVKKYSNNKINDINDVYKEVEKLNKKGEKNNE